MEPQFRRLMSATVTIEPLTGTTGDGTPSYGPGVKVPAAIVPQGSRFLSREADTAVDLGMVFVDATVAVGMADRLTLPDGTQPPILGIFTAWDDRGPHHQEISVGLRQAAPI